MTEIYMTEAGTGATYGPAYVDGNGALTERGEWTIAFALDLLAEAAHRNARAKGWYDEGRGFPEELALVHSEVSEVLEEYRDGRLSDETYYSVTTNGTSAPSNAKPEGIPAESADILIRVADYAGNPDRRVPLGQAVVEKMRYNRSRPVRHGGKLA